MWHTHVCVCERERVSLCVCERESVCMWHTRERACVRGTHDIVVHTHVCESVCVCERERVYVAHLTLL